MSLPNSNIGGFTSKGSFKETDKLAVFDTQTNTTYGETLTTLKKFIPGLKKYAAGTYNASEVFVMYENADGWGLYELVSGVRPFVSSNFDAELLAGSWEYKIGQSSGTFDWNRQITTMPEKGKIIGGVTIGEGLENMFFGDVAPEVSLSVSSPLEKRGAATTNVTVTWSVVKKTNPITIITVAGQSITPTGNSQSGSTVINIPSNVDYDFEIVASDGVNQTVETAGLKFMSGMRIGSTPDQTITDADINAITPELREDRLATRVGINFNGQYALIVYPATMGEATIIINGLPNSAWQRSEKTYVNSLGYSETVKVLVSNTVQAGSTNLQIT